LAQQQAEPPQERRSGPLQGLWERLLAWRQEPSLAASLGKVLPKKSIRL
jgi:hypothetical protein